MQTKLSGIIHGSEWLWLIIFILITLPSYGQLAQFKDVDLAVESHRAEGLNEKKAVSAVAEELHI